MLYFSISITILLNTINSLFIPVRSAVVCGIGCFRGGISFELQLINQTRVGKGCKGQVGVSPIVKSAVTYIRQHLHEKITLSQLASSIAVSESYLSTLFHKEMQESCITYINRSKIELAKTLLASGALVYEVSGQLGFDNSNYFGKVFKKYTGSTPEAYRALHNSGTEG